MDSSWKLLLELERRFRTGILEVPMGLMRTCTVSQVIVGTPAKYKGADELKEYCIKAFKEVQSGAPITQMELTYMDVGSPNYHLDARILMSLKATTKDKERFSLDLQSLAGLASNSVGIFHPPLLRATPMCLFEAIEQDDDKALGDIIKRLNRAPSDIGVDSLKPRYEIRIISPIIKEEGGMSWPLK